MPRGSGGPGPKPDSYAAGDRQQAPRGGGLGSGQATSQRAWLRSPVSDAETALVSMLSVTTLRVQRLKTRPGIRRQKWKTSDIIAWHGTGQGPR